MSALLPVGALVRTATAAWAEIEVADRLPCLRLSCTSLAHLSAHKVAFCMASDAMCVRPLKHSAICLVTFSETATHGQQVDSAATRVPLVYNSHAMPMHEWCSIFLYFPAKAVRPVQVVKRIWAHIKQHDLQDPRDRRKILPDHVLGTFLTAPVNMMSMNAQLSKHCFTKGKRRWFLNEVTTIMGMLLCLRCQHIVTLSPVGKHNIPMTATFASGWGIRQWHYNNKQSHK